MEAGIDSILVPETVLPSQYYDSRRKTSSDSPVGRLMLAVLADAIRSFQKYAAAPSTRGRRLFADTEQWFFDPSDDAPFSFACVCENLGIDTHTLLAGLKQWRAQRLAGVPSRRIGRRSPVLRDRKISVRAKRPALKSHPTVIRSVGTGKPALIAAASQKIEIMVVACSPKTQPV